MDNTDEIEICRNIKPHELMDVVNSQAVVKYSTIQMPNKFNRLECNTNLNLPPSNWLTTSTYSGSGLHQALYQSPGFSSFRLAHMFPDCMGEVDVVSDAENIKKLLKLPYSRNTPISMIVHKVGNTLLLDEFDIQRYLLRQASDDWKWLRTFIVEHLLAYGEKDHSFCLRDKSREALQSKNLLSKFLYHSVKSAVYEEKKKEGSFKIATPPMRVTPILPSTDPVLPEPKIEENIPDPKSAHTFNRNVLWTFEDLRMLIGTDMPIFGGPNRPCISLRLRDMSQPINVLTGVDYWLDNLMCNVPEVVMCYHIDGIVQKYEIIKTEDLPYLENSQFSPQIVRNVAQNILAFLKVNATKAGHTYWLFKGRNDDVVKLYDLTTLCKHDTGKPSSSCSNKTPDEKLENPFTVPVAMLLYTVARNMKNTRERISAKTAGSIKSLLTNCIKLLPKEKYPQIVSSSHYILSDLHIPAGIDPKAPIFDISDEDSESWDDEDLVESSSDSNSEHELSCHNEISKPNVALSLNPISDTLKEFNINEAKQHIKHPPRAPSPLMASTMERCRASLEHINSGISCLQFFDTNEELFLKESEARAKAEEKQRIIHEEQNPNMAKPFKPIPLPYATLADIVNQTKEQHTKLQTSQLKRLDMELEIELEVDIDEEENDRKIKPKPAKTRRIKTKEFNDLPIETTPLHACSMPVQQLQQLRDQQLQQQQQIAVNFNTQNFGSWNIHLKLLLLEKACLTYATMAEHNYVTQQFGACLRAIYMSIRCQEVVTKYVRNVISQKSLLLGRAGDCFFQMSKNWATIDAYIAQFHDISDYEDCILNELEKDLELDDESDLIVPKANIEQIMVSSCHCYQRALKVICDTANNDKSKKELLRRLGNACNDLGLKYMYWSQGKYFQTYMHEGYINYIMDFL